MSSAKQQFSQNYTMYKHEHVPLILKRAVKKEPTEAPSMPLQHVAVKEESSVLVAGVKTCGEAPWQLDPADHILQPLNTNRSHNQPPVASSRSLHASRQLLHSAIEKWSDQSQASALTKFTVLPLSGESGHSDQWMALDSKPVLGENTVPQVSKKTDLVKKIVFVPPGEDPKAFATKFVQQLQRGNFKDKVNDENQPQPNTRHYQGADNIETQSHLQLAKSQEPLPANAQGQGEIKETVIEITRIEEPKEKKWTMYGTSGVTRFTSAGNSELHHRTLSPLVRLGSEHAQTTHCSSAGPRVRFEGETKGKAKRVWNSEFCLLLFFLPN